MGKIISNGIEYGGLTNVNGMYINTNNVIYTNVSSVLSESYTATEDCYIMQDVVCGGGHTATVKINGVTVAEYYYSGSTFIIPYTVLLKKGQILSVTHGVSTSHTVNVYGVQQGSASRISYSTTEQNTGQKWVDGKDIYQKTIYYAGGTSGGTYTIPHNILNLGDVIKCEGFCGDANGDNPHMVIPRIAPDNANFGFSAINDTNILFTYASLWSSRLIDLYITIQYTKSTV